MQLIVAGSKLRLQCQKIENEKNLISVPRKIYTYFQNVKPITAICKVYVKVVLLLINKLVFPRSISCKTISA